jgi:Histidine kinase/Two component regulator propeller
MLHSNNHIIAIKLLLVFLLAVSVSSQAQDPVYRNINNLDGLPSNSVYNILQDKQGFIWLGHDKGLSRYDGKTFKQYRANTQQGRSLSNLMQAGNNVWCQDFTGNFYYTQGDSLQQEKRIPSMGIYTTAGFIQKNILVSVSWDNIQSLNIETGKLKMLKQEGGNGKAIFFQQDSMIFIHKQGLSVFDGAASYFSASLPTKSAAIYFLQKFGGEYYGFTKNEFPVVYLLKESKAVPLPLLKPGLFIQDINVIDDLLWVSTSAGAWCFDLEMKPAFNGHCFFADRSITKIIKDREGSYWFGTLDNGVLFVPDLASRLYKYENESITALAPSINGKEIYAGTSNNRLLTFDDVNKSFKSLYKEATNHEVLSILEDIKTGNIVFSSDRITFLQQRQKIKEQLSAGKDFVIINEDWYAMAHSGGVSLLARNGNNSRPIPQWLYKKETSWINNQYQLISNATRGRSVAFNEKDSILYCATASGIYYFSPAGSGKVMYKGKDIYASQIIMDGATAYVATYSDGLFLIKEGKKAIPVNSAGKPISNTIYKLFKGTDWLWLLADGLLQKYNPATGQLVEYTNADGLPRAEIKDVVVLFSNVYVATTEGLVVFNEYSSNDNAVAPLLVINKMLVNNEAVDWKQKLALRNRQNNIAIDFSLLSFKGEDSLRIEYKINKGEWQTLAAGARVLNLPSLSSGKYLVSIKGFNKDGVPTATPIEISFSIAAAFYKQWSFLICMLLLGMALVYFYFKWRLRNEKKRSELLSQKAKLEQELQQSLLSSIKSQMNPHFLFNALNTIQSYIYTSDKENASQYLGKFSELTRMILDMSNNDIVPLADEIKALNLYLELEQLRFEDKLTYTVTVDETISTETTYIHSMLIQPYVENAIKHGLLHLKGPWKLSIDFAKTGNGIKVTVDDNGIGRKRSEELNQLKLKKHQSFASDANQKRLEILNKGLKETISLKIVDKKDEHGNAAGTIVVMHIPFVKKQP